MFSDRLVHLRDKVGLTQEELSKRLGMARTTYQGYENGKREPDLQTLEKIASYYNITVDDLLGRETKENSIEETEEEKLRKIAADKIQNIKNIDDLYRVIDHIDYVENKKK